MANNFRSGDADRVPQSPNARGAISLPPDTPDNFGLSYADPQLLVPNFDAHSRALPFSHQPGDVQNVDLSTVNPLAGIQQPGSELIQVQNIESDLAVLRGMLPYLPIVKFPRTVKTAYMVTALTAYEITVPEGAAIVKFRGANDYYVSFGGRASVPVAPSAAGWDENGSSIYKPETEWFYIGGIKQISFVAPNANTIAQAIFIMRSSPNQGY